MKQSMNLEFIDDFLKGQRDADKGLPHQAGKSEAYDRGYIETLGTRVPKGENNHDISI